MPFPQADNFSKIAEIINIKEETLLTDKLYMRKILGDISDRQVSYYLSACEYLELITEDKNFTELALEIRRKNIVEQNIEYCKLIVSKPIFGEVYFTEKVLNTKLSRNDIIDIMKEKGIDFGSEEVYKRRSTTVKCWIEWINKITNEF